MSFESVKEYLKEYGLDDRAMEFPVSSASVALAAEAVGCLEKRNRQNHGVLKSTGKPFSLLWREMQK